MKHPKSLFSYRPFWAHRFGPAPFLPMSRAEMEDLGWDSCDIILVTGDAYVDHPSFGMAIIGRLLESQGFRVGIISQPEWSSPEAFKVLGPPNLFWGVTAGNMDSMVNRYTADRRIRHNDSYTPNDEGDKRPDRATIVYAQRCREAFKDIPIVIGGIEASLRRITHYDYWSDKIRRSILVDAKADILLYGNAERALVEVAHRIAKGENPKEMFDVRGVALATSELPEGWVERDMSDPDVEHPKTTAEKIAVRMPGYEQVKAEPFLYAQASRILHQESNASNAFALIQDQGVRDVFLSPPPIPLSTEEMDGIYGLPYARAPHPVYGDARIPAWEMIKFSVNIMRGCFGGCSFCSITEHEGRVVQNRSQESIIKEIEDIRDKVKGFTGQISDLGGPTANMYRLACKDDKIQATCRRLSCVYPSICVNLKTDHSELIDLYRKARNLPGIKKISIASGLRYDLAVKSPTYVKELVEHHVGGYLKIAPEHTEEGPLSKMMKPGIGTYDRFKQMFETAAKKAGKKYYLIPYFIAAHPGTSDEDMMNLAMWLKRQGLRADQVQTFLPSPMSLSTAMYHSERNPMKAIHRDSGEVVKTAKGLKQRRLHKAFLRYHDANNWPMIREALKRMGRTDLIGPSKKHLVPTWQPKGTGHQGGAGGGEGTRTGRKHGEQKFFTQQAGEGRRKNKGQGGGQAGGQNGQNNDPVSSGPDKARRNSRGLKKR